MGKPGNKKKKAVAASPGASVETENVVVKKNSENPSPGQHAAAPILDSLSAPTAVAGTPSLPRVEQFAAAFLRRAHELKEEGNRRFQSKDYQGALAQYEQALKLMPRNHLDRAVFHSNRAACLMQIKPVQFEAVVHECTLALEIHPKFHRALFRRARAFESLGKLELALHDVQTILQEDATHQDALGLAKRVRVSIQNREEAQRDMQWRTGMAASCAGTSPAAVGASVVRGSPSPVTNRGPSLPARPLAKKRGVKLDQPALKPGSLDDKQKSICVNTEPTMNVAPPTERRGSFVENFELKEASNSSDLGDKGAEVPKARGGSVHKIPQSKGIRMHKEGILQSRPLKLVYDHDIRLAQLPANCHFRDLRALVGKRFPSSKAVLIKYRDAEGDLITITNTEELRLAEAAASATGKIAKSAHSENEQSIAPENSSVMAPLRLHVVEVNIEQEPILSEEDDYLDNRDSMMESDEKTDCCNEKVGNDNSPTDSIAIGHGRSQDVSDKKGENRDKEADDGKEFEIDEWLLDFAHLFRAQIGVDPDAHVDLHELGMEFCSEALEETVTSESAQPLLEAAAHKFQEVAALAFFNWGNVYMCAARKRIPLEESSDKSGFCERLQAAYDWAQSQFELAGTKYEEALRVKPDFYEGMLALGQESFESAKLRWSLAVASEVDLKAWDSSETIELFKQAEERMLLAVELWDRLEERQKEMASSNSKKDSFKLGTRGSKKEFQDRCDAETMQEQSRVMWSQINLFWGNILFEHSQVEYRLGFPTWDALLDAVVKKFELAGASRADIGVVLKSHAANKTHILELEGSNVRVCKHKPECESVEGIQTGNR